MSIEAPSLEAVKFPVVVVWEVAYPNGRVSRGGCRIDDWEVYCSFLEILSAEDRDDKNIVAPVCLVPSGTRFCPEHGERGTLAFCTECGTKTEEPVKISHYVYDLRFCPEHGDATERFNLFCGQCGKKTLLRKIIDLV